jgi:2-polyprenyl-3-methyl-5-hydroxy-6-metoxy-1,4-benzoquinol methylase
VHDSDGFPETAARTDRVVWQRIVRADADVMLGGGCSGFSSSIRWQKRTPERPGGCVEVHQEHLTDVARYIEHNANVRYEEQLPIVENVFETVGLFKSLNQSHRILEIGVGNGWLQIYGKQKGYDINGLEISHQLIDLAKQNAAKVGTDIDVTLGNIEDSDVGQSEYDVVIASSVFEHVEDWQTAVARVYRALKPGGVFYFDSTNKFSFISGEYAFPLYGWLPNRLRFGLRKWRHGKDIMKLGIDFNQFTYPQLRRAFTRAGFSNVKDFIEFKDPSRIRSSAGMKRVVLAVVRKSKLLKSALLTFSPATIFVCVK